MERLTYRDFKKAFLLELVIAADADPTVNIDPTAAARKVEGLSNDNWIWNAMLEFKDDGLVIGENTFNDDWLVAKITSSAIDQAEEWMADLGYINGLDYEIEERHRAAETGFAPLPIVEATLVTQAGPVPVAIDRTSEAFRRLDELVRQAASEIATRNELVAATPEATQRMAEMRGGMELLQAEQADPDLITRLLVQSLQWFLGKVRDEAAKLVIIGALGALIVYFKLPIPLP